MSASNPMPRQADPPFTAYGGEATGSAPTLALFIDRPHLREQVREDAAMAGYRVIAAEPLTTFARAGETSRADVVLIDCPAPDGASLAALARQDMTTRAERTRLIVATSLASLDDLFGCLDQSHPHILVDPGAADLAVALGVAKVTAAARGVRELADENRRELLRLAEQVSRLAARLERLDEWDGDDPVDRLAAPAMRFRGADEGSERLISARPARFPDPRLVRRIIRRRQQRASYFGTDLFADPAWDMLLDLTAAHGEGASVSVTSLCIASGVPATTALRWIGQMTEAGLFRRVSDSADRRRAFIALTDQAIAAVSAYFAAIKPRSDLPI